MKGPVKEFFLEEITIAIKKMILGKASELSVVSMEMINASGKVGIVVMMKLCQRVLSGKGKPEDWKSGVMVLIYKGKGDVTNCGSYRGEDLVEHGMKMLKEDGRKK